MHTKGPTLLRTDLLQVLSDREAPPARRVVAASDLSEWSEDPVLEALIRVAREDDEDASVSRAAGNSIAQILLRRGDVDQVPLYDFNEDAFLAYDEAIARHQQPR
jgi:hypothetical protein